MSDHDTIIYLFGTFHALDARSAWFGHSIKAAFDASDELVLETVVPEDPTVLHSMLARNAMSAPPVAGQSVIDDGAGFAASAGKAMSAGRRIGMTVDKGADAVLRRAADAAGKPVGGLESFEYQLRMFRSLAGSGTQSGGPAAQGSPSNLAGLLRAMQSAWLRGDGETFAAVLAGMEAQSPATYRTLFAERNANWAQWVAGRMEQPGTVFVAVGTGHLIGPDSVQRKLYERGIASARIS